MICPWCMHCGAYDEDYHFDGERYCGICGQQMPRGRDGWVAAFAALTPDMIAVVESELNKIASSKSGLKPEVLAGMAEVLDDFARLRLSERSDDSGQDAEYYARWLDFATTYYPPA
ncbi:MAG: hypothetical protein ACYDCQ_12910 [Dehalococcoidia bacterium]